MVRVAVLLAWLPSVASCWCGDGSCNSECKGGINGAPAMPDGFCVWIAAEVWGQPDEYSHDQACCACPTWGCSEPWLKGDLAACNGMIGDEPGPTLVMTRACDLRRCSEAWEGYYEKRSRPPAAAPPSSPPYDGRGPPYFAIDLPAGFFFATVMSLMLITRTRADRDARQRRLRRLAVADPASSQSQQLPVRDLALSDLSVATVVTGVAVAAESAAAKPPLTLKEMVDELKRELGIASEASMPTVIDAACAQLGVDGSGGLMEKTQRCWRTLHGSNP